MTTLEEFEDGHDDGDGFDFAVRRVAESIAAEDADSRAADDVGQPALTTR